MNRIGTMTDGRRESHISLPFNNRALIHGALKRGQVKTLLTYLRRTNQSKRIRYSTLKHVSI